MGLMRWQNWIVLGVALFLSGWLISRGLGTRLPPADLRFGNVSEPQTLDPGLMTGLPEGRIARALFEGLTIPNLADLTKPLPGVAMSWRISPDGKTYTYYLRENARWSNGQPVTADHFRFSWLRVLDPATGSQYAELLWPIRHARTFNQQTNTPRSQVGIQVHALRHPLPPGYSQHAVGRRLVLEVTLERPTAYWNQIVSFYAMHPVYPPVVLKHPRQWVLPQHFVGNGPFRLTHWMINELVRVEKNPLYWNASQIQLNSIHFLAVSERDTQLSMYLANDLDIVTYVPLPSIPYLLPRRDFYSRPFLATYFYRINVKQPPLDNKYFRQALSWAIDRESLVKHILRAGQLPAYRLVPPNIRGYPESPVSAMKFDPQKARMLLRKAGYKQGSQIPPISLLYNTDQQHKQIAEALQKMWRQHLGLRVHLVNKEWKTYLDDLRQRNYQMARSGWIGDYTDPHTFLSVFVATGGHNRTGWGHVLYDQLVRQAETETHAAKRMRLFHQAEQILMDELPILPLYFYNYQNLIRPEIQGHLNNPLNFFDYRRLRRIRR